MDNNQPVQHSEGTFMGKDGFRIFEQWWSPSGTPRGIVVIVHGYAEHSGRYAYVANALAEHGYLVGALDHRGHGHSDGKFTRLKSFDDYLYDLDLFTKRAHQKGGDKPLFILGHSMGGAISVLYAITRQPKDVRGFVLSGAGIRLANEMPRAVVKVVGALGTIFPNVPTIKLDGTAVSRDPLIVERYDSDPLNYRGGVPARTAAEISKAGQRILAKMEDFIHPVLIIHGSADRLVNPEGSHELYARATSTDKTLKIYEGYYHEVLNEPEKDQVIGDVIAWLDARC